MNPFVKQPDPLGTREQAPALSEEQVSLRSNLTASGNAQLTDDTAAWNAESTYYVTSTSPWRSCDCVTDGSQPWVWDQGLQTAMISASREAGVD